MKTAPSSRRTSSARRRPAPAAVFGDVYHPRAGAFEQARHVFLAGGSLPDAGAAMDS